MRKCSRFPHIYTAICIIVKTLDAAAPLVPCVLCSAIDNSARARSHSSSSTAQERRRRPRAILPAYIQSRFFCLCRSTLQERKKPPSHTKVFFINSEEKNCDDGVLVALKSRREREKEGKERTRREEKKSREEIQPRKFYNIKCTEKKGQILMVRRKREREKMCAIKKLIEKAKTLSE